jgi:hypothetical protein
MKITMGYVETSPNEGFGMYCYVVNKNNRSMPIEQNIKKYLQMEGDVQAYYNLFKNKRSTNRPFIRGVLFTIGENPNYKYAKTVNVE